MILESLVTTTDRQGAVNLAPMGPRVEGDFAAFQLRPFVSSRTHANLRATGNAVVHVTDDCLLLARGAIGRVDPLPPLCPVAEGRGVRLRDCCRWFAVQVDRWDEDPQRPTAHARVVDQGEVRPFFGLNRAKHAIVEAAILATRTHLLPRPEILAQLQPLRTLIEKTGGDSEHTAFAILERHILESPLPEAPSAAQKSVGP